MPNVQCKQVPTTSKQPKALEKAEFKHPTSKTSTRKDIIEDSSNASPSNDELQKHTSVDVTLLSQVTDHVHIEENTIQSVSKGTMDINQFNNPIHVAKYDKDSKKYDLSKTLPTDSQLVKDQREFIEKRLRLKTLSEDLSSLSKFVRLACCGVVGHTDLQIKTREILISIGDITDDTFHTLQDFETTSEDALQTMQAAYGFLKENLEEQAISMFREIQQSSEKMCEISKLLSEKCKMQSTEVNKLGNETLQEKAHTTAQKEETDRDAHQKTAEKEYQKIIITDIDKKVDEKKKKVADAIQDEKEGLDKINKLTEEAQEKLKHERHNVEKIKAELKSKFDTDYAKILDEIKMNQKKYEDTLLSNKETYEKTLKVLDETCNVKIQSAESIYEENKQQNNEEFQKADRENNVSYEQATKELKENYDRSVSGIETEYQFTEEEINKEYQDAIQASNEELENMLTLATQKLEAALAANEKIYNAKIKAWKDKGITEVHEEWSKRDAEEMKIKHEMEKSAKTNNITAYKLAQECRDRKLNTAKEDKKSKLAEAETTKSQNLLSIKKSYEQKLEDLDKTFTEKMKSAQDTYDVKIKQSEMEFQGKKREKDKLYEQKIKEQKKNYDKTVFDAETEYQFTEEKIKKEYQDAIQASNNELENMLILATQTLEAALEANVKIYSAKIESSINKGKAEVHEKWAEKHAEEIRIKSESDNYARAKNIAAHKLAQQYRDRELNKALEDKQSKVAKAETDLNQNLSSIKVPYEQSLAEHEDIFKEKMKPAGDSYEEKINQNEEFQEAKREKIEAYEQKVKELKESYHKSVADAETEYELTKENINKKYQDAIQASNVELENMLTLATQTLDATTLEHNEKLYNAKANACWTDEGKDEVHKEWPTNVSDDNDIKIAKQNSARSNNEVAHKRAQEIRENKLNAAWEDKQSKIVKAETDMNQNLLLTKESYDQSLKELYGTFKKMIKFTEDANMKQNKEGKNENICYEQKNKQIIEHKENFYTMVFDADKTGYQFTTEQTDKQDEDATEASSDELESRTKLTFKEAALGDKKLSYNAKVKALTDKGKPDVNEEWSKRDTEEKGIKYESENSAMSSSIRAHKIEQETKDRELNTALVDKQSRAAKAETDMNQALLSDNGSYEQILDKVIKVNVKSANLTYEESYEQTIKEYKEKYNKIVTDAETEYQLTKLKINKEYQDAIQKSNDELENMLTLATLKLHVALEANKKYLMQNSTPGQIKENLNYMKNGLKKMLKKNKSNLKVTILQELII